MTDWTQGHDRVGALEDDTQVAGLEARCEAERSRCKEQDSARSMVSIALDPMRTPGLRLTQLPVLPREAEAGGADCRHTPRQALRSGELSVAYKNLCRQKQCCKAQRLLAVHQ